MDVNDDGKVDEQDVKIIYEKILDVVSFNMPAGSGFTGGFLAGVKSGWFSEGCGISRDVFAQMGYTMKNALLIGNLWCKSLES